MEINRKFISVLKKLKHDVQCGDLDLTSFLIITLNQNKSFKLAGYTDSNTFFSMILEATEQFMRHDSWQAESEENFKLFVLKINEILLQNIKKETEEIKDKILH